ncbi:MAG: hypothetical protein A3I05_06595 [Deltaproteobacteria bacterium RIFCSPLOWO2_02_FULL_44_10]|nr:MAG: hypothetical protein A3C46_06795 [Deltaproteobacteria bacterium RIFCSPHIGHO2_02_FULL_44_16]OGQ46700.1 MAG: hypothetical protein A3I05_06595 [Deltaproteobacteria bacterium RIFCSPLOWO2_02_FULL_44_10]
MTRQICDRPVSWSSDIVITKTLTPVEVQKLCSKTKTIQNSEFNLIDPQQQQLLIKCGVRVVVPSAGGDWS